MTDKFIEIHEPVAEVIHDEWGEAHITWLIKDSTDVPCLPAGTKLYTAPQPNKDLISRDAAIKAILDVGGQRVWEFADAIKFLGK